MREEAQRLSKSKESTEPLKKGINDLIHDAGTKAHDKSIMNTETVKVPYEYGLLIGGSRRTWETFDSLDALKKELSRYFTPRELASGIVDRLTTFNEKKIEDDMVTNNYKSFSIICYYEEREMPVKKTEHLER